MNNLILNTPVEEHEGIWVKREDLCCPPPGPPFSKVRGLMVELEELANKGFETIGYTETSISMAGWGVAYGCKLLGLRAVIYDPQYKNTPSLLKYHRKQWKKFDATIIPIKAGMAKVNYHISRNLLLEEYGQTAAILPLGLPFASSVGATYEEAIRTRKRNKDVDGVKTVVVNIGSGTIAAGVLRAFPDKLVCGVMGRTGDYTRKQKSIYTKAGMIQGGLLGKARLEVYDPGYEYTQRSPTNCPFPCHPFYDLKAWEWLMRNRFQLKEPILFWNIGRIK